ncbi:hypothetical protein LGZ35_004213, partial [Escherichia coli]|nr:hypothetical protein [Escherichia coli]
QYTSMFGGGDVDLRRILSAVSDEIEGEFGEGKGLNFAMFENSTGLNNCRTEN